MSSGSIARVTAAMLGVAAACGGAFAADPVPQRPFETFLPWSLDRGDWEVAAGLLRRGGTPAPFFPGRRDLSRDEWRLSLIDATLGVGSGGEVQVRFGLQRFHEEGGTVESGVEDARILFTYEVPTSGPAVAVRFGAKLPNAPERKRLGTDAADLFLIGATGMTGTRGGWAANVGLGILGSPTDAGVQDDVLIVGLAGWLTSGTQARLRLVGEVWGRAASRFGNDERLARVGLLAGRRLPIDLSLRRGLTSASERWGIEAGVTVLLPARPR